MKIDNKTWLIRELAPSKRFEQQRARRIRHELRRNQKGFSLSTSSKPFCIEQAQAEQNNIISIVFRRLNERTFQNDSFLSIILSIKRMSLFLQEDCSISCLPSNFAIYLKQLTIVLSF